MHVSTLPIGLRYLSKFSTDIYRDNKTIFDCQSQHNSNFKCEDLKCGLSYGRKSLSSAVHLRKDVEKAFCQGIFV